MIDSQNFTIEKAQQLLDFSKPFDLVLLENIITLSYSSNNLQQAELCNELLECFRNHPKSWSTVDKIVENSKHPETRHFGLQILEKTIHKEWKLIPPLEKEAIRNYIIGTIIKISSDPSLMSLEKVFLTKLNIILVEILKKEWPTDWPSFIPDIVASSKKNEILCMNNMQILSLFEEIFEFSARNLTQVKIKKLKQSITEEFSEVFCLCIFIFENSKSIELNILTLNTLWKFLSWIPLGYIFETTLLSILVKFLAHTDVRNSALKCLAEIAAIPAEDKKYNENRVDLAVQVQYTVTHLIPFEDLKVLYGTTSDPIKDFIRILALFYSNFLKTHVLLLEDKTKPLVIEMHECLLHVSEVEDKEIFKICIDYWTIFSDRLARDHAIVGKSSSATKLKDFYSKKDVIGLLRLVMINKMVKPVEVLVVIGENGEPVREFLPPHTDTIYIFNTLQEILANLTKIDFMTTTSVMEEHLSKIITSDCFDWNKLNTLCWAIGAISGSMSIIDERSFLVQVIRQLLSLCERSSGKSNKAIVASNIMYVVGQYPRFLQSHWKFLKVVVKKLFEFMHELHEGVQDMGCDTFMKISKSCTSLFIKTQLEESKPFVYEILEELEKIVSDLQPQQIRTFYECIGIMIRHYPRHNEKQKLIEMLMTIPNSLWNRCVNSIQSDCNIISNFEFIQSLSHFIRINISACSTIGHSYSFQMNFLFDNAMKIYELVCHFITQFHSQDSTTNAEFFPVFRKLCQFKTEMIKLFTTWISFGEEWQLFKTTYLNSLFNIMLNDYQTCTPETKDAEILNLLNAIVVSYHFQICGYVPSVLDAVLDCTLDMIKEDFSRYPTHRTSFFVLLETICSKCFKALTVLNEMQFETLINAMIWAFKHTMRQVSESGLSMFYKLLDNINSDEMAQTFYPRYYFMLLEHLFAVISDSSFCHARSRQCDILSLMIKTVDTGIIKSQLMPQSQSNSQSVQLFLQNLFVRVFPTLTETQISTIISQLFTHYSDKSETFESIISDFLVQINVHENENEIQEYVQEAQIKMNRIRSRNSTSNGPTLKLFD